MMSLLLNPNEGKEKARKLQGNGMRGVGKDRSFMALINPTEASENRGASVQLHTLAAKTLKTLGIPCYAELSWLSRRGGHPVISAKNRGQIYKKKKDHFLNYLITYLIFTYMYIKERREITKKIACRLRGAIAQHTVNDTDCVYKRTAANTMSFRVASRVAKWCCLWRGKIGMKRINFGGEKLGFR